MDLISGKPPWAGGAPPAGIGRPLRRAARCDVAIIGAGVAGAFCAHELARAGAAVIVLDRREIGRGSTAASTGLLQYELDTSLHELAGAVGEEAAAACYRACAEGVEYIGALVPRLPRACGFAWRESLCGAASAADAAALRREVALRRAHGLRAEYWDEARLRRSGLHEYRAALHSRPAAEIDTRAFTFGLLEVALAAGARVFGGTLVRSYRPDGTGVRLDLAGGGTVRARRLVIATGYELEPFLELKGTRLVSTFALASRPLAAFPGWPRRCLLWETSRPYHYLRTTPEGRAIIGGEDRPFRDAARRDLELPGCARRLADRFRRLFPEIPFETEHAWAGTFAVSRDGLPFIGEHPQLPRAWLALVYGGNGIPFAALAARQITEWWRGERSAPPLPFRADR